MININGKITSEKDVNIGYQNRAFKYGDGIFDTLKYSNKKILFIEEHYFRLMSSMRMLRMHIPMDFTLKYYEDEIVKTIPSNSKNEEIRIRVSVYRKDGGLYNPKNNAVNFIMEATINNALPMKFYEIELYKDFPIYSGLLSTIKTNNRMVNVLASLFASENKYQNCILINENKNIVEATNANIFLIKGNVISTPSLEEGCINGIIRKKIIELLQKETTFEVVETALSPFDLLKAEEIFLTNSIVEIQSVHKYRKRELATKKTEQVREMFLKMVNLNLDL